MGSAVADALLAAVGKLEPVSGDGLRLPLAWGDESASAALLAGLSGRVIRLAFRLRKADLFAFEFHA